MGSRRRASRRTYVTLVAVTTLHAAFFLLLAHAIAPPLPPMARDVVVAPVYLARLAPSTKRREAAALRRGSQPMARSAIPPVLSAPPRPSTPAGPAPLTAPAVSADIGDADRARLTHALRAGGVGCATPHLLSAQERADCERRLAAGAKLASYIPTPLPPERRAFYDAVAKAKQPFHAEPMRPGENPVPTPGAGRDGSLAALQTASANGVPLVGCKISFGGPGAGVAKPPHSLKLGRLPCFITPPQGPFTVEANIRNPDTMVKSRD
jgi:hypothetical protein